MRLIFGFFFSLFFPVCVVYIRPYNFHVCYCLGGESGEELKTAARWQSFWYPMAEGHKEKSSPFSLMAALGWCV